MSTEAHEPVSPTHDLRKALEGIADDYMTSEQHHPGYVLIPTAKFEQLRAASVALSTPTGEMQKQIGDFATTRAEGMEPAAAHPQQGGERDGEEPCPSIHLLRKAYDAGFAASGDGWDGDRPDAQDDPDYKRQREDEIFLIADREPVAPIQPSKSSGEEA